MYAVSPFASLDGTIFDGVTYFDGKSNAVGMLTKIKIAIAHGILAGLRVTNQATAKFSLAKLGYLAIISIWQSTKFFHRIFLAFLVRMSNHSFIFCS